jgi:hypothetical protein
MGMVCLMGCTPYASVYKNRSRGRSRDSALYQGKGPSEMDQREVITPDLELLFWRRPICELKLTYIFTHIILIHGERP